MKRGIHAVLFSSFVAFAAYAPSSGAVVAKVNAVGTYDDGAIYIFFDKAISDCSTTNRLDLAANNPSVKHVLAIAMTAFTTGSNVEIHPGSCSGAAPEFSTSGDSFFFLTK
ncbi:MAG: hypothetical protein HY273_17385 [Gammaproteobacteria bacterium]|nr:hypothetical protein [Gammaproteobacteria bacterium]